MASGRVPNTVKIFIKLLCVFRVNSYQTGAFLELAFRQSPRHFSQFQLRESTLHRFFFILTEIVIQNKINMNPRKAISDNRSSSIARMRSCRSRRPIDNDQNAFEERTLATSQIA